MDEIIIKRDGLPPITFTGELIGDSRHNRDSTRWTKVEIYRTRGGKYVATLARITCWEGESDSRSATSKETATGIIEWLKEGAESLGRVSQTAVEEAAKVDSNFASAWVEEVE